METNPWTSVPTDGLIKSLEHFYTPRFFYQGHMQQGAVAEVLLIRAELKSRNELPSRFATLPPHWRKGRKHC